MTQQTELKLLNTDYESRYGFKDQTVAVFKTPKGLNEGIVREISRQKQEPEWMLQLRLNALKIFLSKPMPQWGANLNSIDFENITYYLKPSDKKATSWDEVPEAIKKTFDRLGIPEAEQKFLGGVGAQYESEVVYHKLREDLESQGVVFLDTDTALQKYPELFKKWFGKIVPPGDNKFSALNTAFWSGGSFIYIPPKVKVDVPLQAYFRINSQNMGQFERTLIIADEGAEVHYVEGCLPYNEEISAGDELVSIQEIKEGQVVLNSKGEDTIVKKTMVRPYDGDLVEITPVSVGNKFSLTPEHPVLVIKRNKILAVKRKNRKLSDVSRKKFIFAQPEFVDAKHLAEGDFLVYPINQVTCDHKEFSDELLQVFGYYLAEGHAGKINNCDAMVLSFNSNERMFIDNAKETIFKSIGKTPSEFHNPGKHELKLTVYSKELVELCKRHCGTFSENKKLSKEIMELPPERQRLLLKTYYRGDGSVYISNQRKGKVVRAITISRALAYQLQELLARQGIYATINIREPYKEKMKDGKVINHKRKYTVYYQDSKRFRTVKKDDKFFFVPIRKISRKHYAGQVYNFEVSGEPNTYLVKGFAVHNCSAPVYATDSLHSAVVEIVAMPGSKVRYTTIQNWSGDVYNLVTKRAFAFENAYVEWLDFNLGSKATMKYPSVYLKGQNARADILSIAYAGKGQHQDAGGKAVHLAPNTCSRIISKSVSKDGGRTSYRGLVRVEKGCTGVVSNVRCDALMLDSNSRSDTYPVMQIKEETATISHEASVGRIGDDQLFYLMSRGFTESEAMAMIVLGFISEFTKELPMEYAIELNKLIQLNMENAIG